MAPQVAGTNGDPALTDPATVRTQPKATIRALERANQFGLTKIDLRWRSRQVVAFGLELEPWRPMAAAGYPTEHVTIAVWDDDHVMAVPHRGSTRTWQHRNCDTAINRSPKLLRGEWGTLCLWYDRDPETLKWQWADGLDQYVTIVHRHLQAEEYARRNHGLWPVEDAPHGSGLHPIRTVAFRAAAQNWRRVS